MKKALKIAYGMSHFEDIINNNYVYIDRTQFIKKLDDSSKYIFFLRPRRFGKSLFCNMLADYYINKKDKSNKLFKGLYIDNFSTQNKYIILNFNFSSIDVNKKFDNIREQFIESIREQMLVSLWRYRNILEYKV